MKTDDRRRAKSIRDRADYEARKARRAQEAEERAQAARKAEADARIAAEVRATLQAEARRVEAERVRIAKLEWEAGKPAREAAAAAAREAAQAQQAVRAEPRPAPRRIGGFGLLLALAACGPGPAVDPE